MVEKRRDLSDAKALRAMAHPVRWKLLEIVKREGSATATQCAKETGESVASCSYHLNMLAKYDFVEQAEGGQGREKPWRPVYTQQGWSDVGMEPEAELAAEAATQAFFEYEFDLAKQRLRESSAEPDEWRLALGSHSTDEWLTPQELGELRAELEAAANRFRERKGNRDARPAEARPVHVFMTFSVTPQRD
jgi:helix-turn-helix protein